MDIQLKQECNHRLVEKNRMIEDKLMTEDNFTGWVKWIDRDILLDLKHPGVYCIAKSESDLSKQDFDWITEIEYVGMTNHQNLKDRLNQFDVTIAGKRWAHGGADRCLRACQEQNLSYQDLSPKLFVSVNRFDFKIKSNEPVDLRAMGDIAKCEFYCIAKYAEKFNKLPKFNDQHSSPKCIKNKN